MQIAYIHHDDDCASPRENDNLGTLCLFRRRYDLPNESILTLEALREYLASPQFCGVQLPVWVYDHGQVAYKAGSRVGCFADQWDSAQAGVIYIEQKKIMEEFGTGRTDEQIAEYLCSEVDEFSKWANGECYGYILMEDGVEVDACWGFIGYDVVVAAAKEAGAERIVDKEN